LAAKEACLRVDSQVLGRALAFFKGSMDPGLDADLQGKLPGLVLMASLYLGDDIRSAEAALLGQKIIGSLPSVREGWGKGWREGQDPADDGLRAQAFDPCRWYLSTYGLFFLGGESWRIWNIALKKSLAGLQDRDGAWRGNDPQSAQWGAVYSTALSVLALQVYYRIH
jgi:hypothetical protein